MKRNKKLLLKAANRIEKIPQSYKQSVFCGPSNSAPCGTTGCLAAEIIICSEPSVKRGIKKLNEVVANWEGPDTWPGKIAGDLAGLTHAERVNLFATASARTWPAPFDSQFKRSKAKTAARLLRYLADDGKV